MSRSCGTIGQLRVSVKEWDIINLRSLVSSGGYNASAEVKMLLVKWFLL